jgi:ring-1,2-phenylacetyl-CoA epoxidase subunit PaaC
VLGSSLKQDWHAQVVAVLEEATLSEPRPSHMLTTGKAGLHSEHLDFLLAEMQVLARAHPGAVW